jgi:hypothetical protein
VTDDRESYCRHIESYLCRKNDGHLVRIVGPAFEQVSSWATRGIPLQIACRGIDRYFERYYAKGPRRRPARIEFCEADVLDLFDEWKRAVGVGTAAVREGDTPDEEDVVAKKRGTLAAHLERVVARLTALRAGEDRSLDAMLETLVRELDTARAGAKGLRGDAREILLARLRVLDADLLRTARAGCAANLIQGFQTEADRQLAPFRSRMPESVYGRSREACIDRLVREHVRLPTIAFE